MAGLRGKSLIMNLPGKPKAIRETIDEVIDGGLSAGLCQKRWLTVSLNPATCVVFPVVQVFASVPACIDLIEGPYIETNEAVVKAFRPQGLVRTAKPIMSASGAVPL